MLGPSGRAIGRRDFIRGVAITGAAVAVTGVPQVASADVQSPTGLVPVYRQSTRGMDVCNACKGQAAHRYFRLPKYADHGRAHLGCNCRILVQEIPTRTWKRYFVRRGGKLRKWFDDRCVR